LQGPTTYGRWMDRRWPWTHGEDGAAVFLRPPINGAHATPRRCCLTATQIPLNTFVPLTADLMLATRELAKGSDRGAGLFLVVDGLSLETAKDREYVRDGLR
jgi:hypothetical protein